MADLTEEIRQIWKYRKTRSIIWNLGVSVTPTENDSSRTAIHDHQDFAIP